jgi:hypothetical protein
MFHNSSDAQYQGGTGVAGQARVRLWAAVCSAGETGRGWARPGVASDAQGYSGVLYSDKGFRGGILVFL